MKTIQLLTEESRQTADSEQHYSDMEYYPGKLTIFIGNENITIPMIMQYKLDDEEVLKNLHMWYQYFKTKRGIVEIIIPRCLALTV